MQNIRRIKIPKMKIVTVSPIRRKKEFKNFEEWWTNYDKKVYT